MVEYRKTFLNKMKLLLPYFVEFSNNRSILPKIYPENCVVDGLNRRPIILIIYNESIFSVNDDQQKVWSLNGHGILHLQKKEKRL